MIEINVKESKNEDELGLYSYQFNEVYIGATLNNDLILTNQEIKEERIRLAIVKDALLLETLATGQFVLINKKKISGRLRLKKGDRVQFGYSLFEISNFGQQKSPDDFPYDKYEKILFNEGPQKNLIVAIENELKKLS